MAFPVVKGPGGKRYELLEGMKQHFLSLYGEWENGTIMCPPLFPRNFISPVGDLPGVPPLKPHVLDTIRGDDAEEKIFEILKQFGEKENQPMFVLTKLKFSEFIKYCIPTGQTIELAEIDFAIVHLNIGVILVEVKATEKWPKRKAFNQLSEGEKIIKGLLHEDSHIPVYKVVALPNMDGSGNCKDDFSILKKSDVGSCEEFSHWMHSHFDAGKCGSQEKQELRNLLYKVVGQRTNVRSSLETVEFSDDVHPKKVLSEHYKKICSQACLRQRHECSIAEQKGKKPTADKCKLDELTECSTAEEKGKKSMRLAKTADEPGLAVMAKDVLFLNPEQLCISEGPNHQLICGVPGSGKTILLQHKALECARKGEKVIICVPSPLNKKYEAFFEAKNISSGVIIYTFENFVNFAPKSEEKFHLFIDELQILLADDIDKTETDYLKSLIEKQNSADKCYCWLTCDDTQVPTSRTPRLYQGIEDFIFDPNFHSYLTYLGVDYLTLTGNHRFTKSYLRTVMRSTVQVCEFVKEFVHKTLIYSQRFLWQAFCYGRDDVPSLLKEFEDWQVVIGHHIGGLPVEEIETAGNLISVAQAVATSIFSELQLWTLKEIAVLVTDDGVLEDLSRSSALPKLLGIPLCAIGEDKDAIVFDHGGKSQSFEWPVVIVVCGSETRPALCYLAFSRAVVKLVVVNVNWPYVVNFYPRIIALYLCRNKSDEKLLFSRILKSQYGINYFSQL